MKYNNLTFTSKKTTQRVGRGIAAGRGKTAGRGTKGQNSRAGSSRKPGFEGGQNPLVSRLPKLRGFHSHRIGVEIVNLADLELLKTTNIDNQVLFTAGLVTSPYTRVKLIGGSEVKRKLSVKLQGASRNAKKAIVAAGGSLEVVSQVARKSKPRAETGKTD